MHESLAGTELPTSALQRFRPELGGQLTLGGRDGEDRSDPFETSKRLAFLASFIHMRAMTVAVITFANLWWRST